MKTKIIAQDRKHLIDLIEDEIIYNGEDCDLNHLDTANVRDMTSLFKNSKFNGDISQWNVANVTSMDSLFQNSLFNGDISKWDVSNVKDMDHMFEKSQFNGDISAWDISNVDTMKSMFYQSQLECDISGWKPINVLSWESTFVCSKMPRPYWYNIHYDSRRKAINIYHLAKKLDNKLISQEERKETKKMKI